MGDRSVQCFKCCLPCRELKVVTTRRQNIVSESDHKTLAIAACLLRSGEFQRTIEESQASDPTGGSGSAVCSAVND